MKNLTFDCILPYLIYEIYITIDKMILIYCEYFQENVNSELKDVMDDLIWEWYGYQATLPLQKLTITIVD